MKKPAADAPINQWVRYREWVREQLKEWDPADDRGSPTVYHPRFNGIHALPNHSLPRSYDDDQD